MRVFLVSEGKHEMGGALEALVVRLLPTQPEFVEERIASIRASHGKGLGFFKKALACMREAQRRDCDAVIVVIDEDGQRERVDQFNSAQDDILFSIPRALGVAIRSFDAWMLADEQALTSVLGCQIQRQSDPETITDPKEVCARLLERASEALSQSEMYHRVVRAANLAQIKERCASGFAPFARRVAAIG